MSRCSSGTASRSRPWRPTPALPRRRPTRWNWRFSALLLQKHVVGRIGRVIERAGLVARAVVAAADRVDALHRDHAGQRAAAAARDHLELEPRNVLRARR